MQERIESAAIQLEGLIAQILDLAKLAHKDELAIAPGDLVLNLRKWVQDVELELANKSPTIEWSLDQPKVNMPFDAVWLHRQYSRQAKKLR